MQISEEQLKEIFDSCCHDNWHLSVPNPKNIKKLTWWEFRKAAEKILALGKPRPLTKNKRTENIFCMEAMYLEGEPTICKRQCSLCSSKQKICRDAASQ